MGKIIRKKAQSKTGKSGLVAIQPNVAGIDIGSRQMHVCGPEDTKGEAPLAVFDTTTAGIEACAQWLKQLGVRSVAMESTGVYWIAPFELLESAGFEVLLVDTRPLSRVPGRKTDASDCAWIQTLHRCGLLQGCYRPAENISQLRTIVRMKAVLVAEQADWLRRMQKCLDQINVRVHHAVAQLNGTTGLAIVRAIVAGQRDPVKLAELRDPRCQKSQAQIAEHLRGHWRSDHLFNLEQALEMYDMLSAKLEVYERQIEKRMKELMAPGSENKQAPPLPNPQRTKAMKRRKQEGKRQELYRMVGADLTAIDGVGVETAEVLVTEYGTDLSKFATEKQFISHLQLAPHQAISGGKQLPKRPRRTKGTRAGRALRTAAVALSRSATALGAYYRRISRTKGATIAVFATARKIGTIIYRLLRWGHAYVDEGQQAYEARFQAMRLRSLAVSAGQLGMQLIPKPEPQLVDPAGGLR